MLQSKRGSYSIEPESIVSVGTKRHKADISIPSKDRKEKFGERISALQQLVSPYGKTDTASVLLEAMEYIRFLQDQVKVLSAPYLQCTPAVPIQDWEECSLRRRGLCLVPISCTAGVAQTNGADMWAPIKTNSLRFDKAEESQFQ